MCKNGNSSDFPGAPILNPEYKAGTPRELEGWEQAIEDKIQAGKFVLIKASDRQVEFHVTSVGYRLKIPSEFRGPLYKLPKSAKTMADYLSRLMEHYRQRREVYLRIVQGVKNMKEQSDDPE